MDHLIKIIREEEWKQKEMKIKTKYFKDIFDELSIELTIENMNKLYVASKSITASFRSSSGKDFEKIIEKILDLNNIEYSRQVYIKHDIVVEKRKESNYTADIIIPKIKIGENIKNYNLISIKTTIRERHLQDNGMNFKQIYLITLDPKIPNNINKNTIIVIPNYIKLIKEYDVRIYDIDYFIDKIKNF